MPSTLTASERASARRLIELALAEDFQQAGDLTCRALIDADANAEVQLVARQRGVVAGLPVAELVFSTLDPRVKWCDCESDGAAVEPGTVVATAAGPLRPLLSGERTALNFLTHLSGVATLTRRFVDAVAGTRASILDTRKTLPGWRLLEKYAVRAGGGHNHRLGLYDGVLIKDNHLAAWRASHPDATVAEAVATARAWLTDAGSGGSGPSDAERLPVEVEVDTIEQLTDALNGLPDIVLLDNMNCDLLREAVAVRNRLEPGVLLEASGGITLDNVAEVARTGVERISVGALTHSAPALDLAFDWLESR